jgi:hypothetical protein
MMEAIKDRVALVLRTSDAALLRRSDTCCSVVFFIDAPCVSLYADTSLKLLLASKLCASMLL